MDENIRKALLNKRYTQEECYKRLGRTRDDVIGSIQPSVALELEFLLEENAENICKSTKENLKRARECFERKFAGRELQEFVRKFPKEIRQQVADSQNNREKSQASLKKGSHGNCGQVLPRDFLKWMGVASIEGWKSYYDALMETVNPYAYSAWIRQGELQVKRPATEFVLNPKEIDSTLAYLRKNVFNLQTNLRHIATDALGDCGIQVLAVPAFVTAPLPDAACYWCGNRPVIQFTANPLSDVRFLKALFHMVGHIMLHSKRTMCLYGSVVKFSHRAEEAVIQQDHQQTQQLGAEHEAELFAEKRFLSEAEECEVICCGRFTERRCIEFFSRVFRIRPGIIVDRLQQQKKLSSRTLLNNLKTAV